jgi:D-sedoheptulose 7-phosphate isomerase
VSARPKVEEGLTHSLAEAAEALRGVDVGSLARAVDALMNVAARGGVIYTAGNGGSAATASHLALDLQKAAGVRALSLSDNPGLITAWGNDTSFDRVFAGQLEVLGRKEDGVIVISVSGSSPNVIALLDVAREKGIASVGLLGCHGGRAAALVDVPVVVPSGDYGWVESVHTVLHHVLTYALRDAVSRGHATQPPARAV